MSGLPPGGLALPIGTVTFLLTDVEGSTQAWEATPDAMAAAIARHYELLDAAISAHGGVRPEEQGEGDSVVAAFSRASDAVLAALAAQRALVAEAWPTPSPLLVRMAIHTGEARLRDEGNYVGQAIIRTARLRAIAHGGQVLISSATRDLAVDRLGSDVELVDLGSHRLKDLARPEHVFQVAHPDLPATFEPLASLDHLPNNLPVELSSFVGREDEIATIGRLVTSNRLVTLTGTGGAGKTRLAQQVAADVLQHFPDGAWWVELAGVTDPAQIAPAIAAAIGETMGLADPLELLTKRLGRRTLLLVIDNCEHLVEPIADVLHVLASGCPTISILTTSRSALNVPGELTWRVPPLSLPLSSRPMAIEALAQYDAVQLFLDRAVRARQNFRLTDDNGADVAAICHRLDGIPLAIELAAARCKVLSPAQIREGLDNALGMLGSGTNRLVRPRQQTIEASIDWSHSLLPADERTLLRRLAIFASPFTLDAAEAVVPDEHLEGARVLDLLERLVDQSLVQMVDSRADNRFRLLETVRQFGRRELASAGETDALEQRHADWFAQRAATLWPLYHGRMIEFLDIADDEHDDMVTTLERLMDHGTAEQLCRMAVGFLPAIGVRHVSEARTWFDRVVDRLGDIDLPVFGELLVRRAEIAMYAGNMEQVFADLDSAQRVGRATTDEALHVSELGIRLVITLMGDPVGTLPAIDDFGRRAAAVGDTHAVSEALMYRAIATTVLGDVVASSSAWKDAVAAVEATGCQRCLPLAQAQYARSLLRSARLDDAERVLRDARRSAALLDEGTTIAFVTAGTLEMTIATGRTPIGSDAAMQLLTTLDEQGEHFALGTLASTAALARLLEGHVAEARAMLSTLADSMFTSTEATCNATLAALVDDDLAGASELAQTAQAIVDQSGDAYEQCRFGLVTAAIARRDLRIDDAIGDAHTALEHAIERAYPLLAIHAVESIAATMATAAGGDAATAARLIGAAERRRDELGYRFRLPCDEPPSGLAPEALAEGSSMEWDTALAFVRRTRGERKRPAFGWDALTPTEREVVAAAAEGLTNPQIAERLLMGRATVKTHMSNVFTKLAITNRAQLAALVASREPREPREPR